jgi:geranylgeranyl pyrophosphate synthase
VDDVLDLRATTDAIGKPANLDLRQGTVTLPTMLFLAQADGTAGAQTLRRMVDGADISDDEYTSVATQIEASGAIDESISAARAYVERAIDRLNDLSDPRVAESLESFANLALERTF